MAKDHRREMVQAEVHGPWVDHERWLYGCCGLHICTRLCWAHLDVHTVGQSGRDGRDWDRIYRGVDYHRPADHKPYSLYLSILFCTDRFVSHPGGLDVAANGHYLAHMDILEPLRVADDAHFCWYWSHRADRSVLN